MLGVIVNTVAVLIGGSVGTVCKKGIPKKITDAIMFAIGLCVFYIGVSGALKGSNTLVLIISMVIGTALGTLIDIDALLEKLGNKIEEKVQKGGEKGAIARGFVSGSLLFCVGSMTIVGSMNAGLKGDNEMLYTKSLLDLISSIMMSASLGIGVVFSSLFVFFFQGGIVLLSGTLSGVLSEAAISEMTCTGSVIIIALAFNLLGISKFKVANFIPAIFVAPLVNRLFELLPFSV